MNRNRIKVLSDWNILTDESFFNNHLSPPPPIICRTLDKLNVSGNIDKDEGGFDALMQVAACYNQFGKL